jgi:Icc-related predicted phosphoesterase
MMLCVWTIGDVQITQTPPAGILDISSVGSRLGRDKLAESIVDASPRLHSFGHVHPSSGAMESDGTTFINAAMVNGEIRLAREPYESHL